MNQHGALDTKTSVQVMEILKRISQDKLIVMVTHNPDLAEKYSTRIIKILDGKITEDSDPVSESELQKKKNDIPMGRTSMTLWTSFRLSLNNLLTKKGRTILVSFAGSIGIIGIALVQAVSNGFQGYVDSIQEDTLTSYPLTVMQESADLTGLLLSMSSQEDKNDNSNEVQEEQYISTMLSNVRTNDLKSFQKYIDENYSEIEKDISSMQNSYSVAPMIYTVDATNKIAKLNPSNLFSRMFSSSMMSSSSSIYSQMIDDQESIKNSYNILEGRLPEKYDEMMIVLSEPNTIPDLLVYSLGLRDTEELTEIVTKIMNGETVDIDNDPLTLSYHDLMNIKLKLIMPTDTYKYNKKYDVYEDMTQDQDYLKDIYDQGIDLKIVGIVTPKEGVSSLLLATGVYYTSDLVDYIIDYSANTDIVKKQLENDEVDVFSGAKFDSDKNKLNFNFADLVSIDSKKLESAFNIKIDQEDLQKQTQGYMAEISKSVTTDTSPAKKAFQDNLNVFANEIFDSINGEFTEEDVDKIVSDYLNKAEVSEKISDLEKSYVIPKEQFKTAYTGLLKALMQVYINAYKAAAGMQGIEVKSITVNQEIVPVVISNYLGNAEIEETANQMSRAMTEALMQKTILTKVGELTTTLTSTFASAFNVDQEKISSAFKLKMSEEEISRIVTAMMSDTKTTASSNLISLGYQDKEEPTYISFYFNSFDGKEHFMDFIDSYNEKMESNGEEDKVIKYTDATGILMSSVKTIVNAVTYVLIAFISISLIVSSIMIGIITYISVYERTKEIGILRAIGASKRNISSIFNAETFIIGLLSGSFGIGITYALIPVINSVLHHFTGNIPLNVSLYFTNAIILVVLSVILTLIGGLIPARAASKKDPVIALRTE